MQSIFVMQNIDRNILALSLRGNETPSHRRATGIGKQTIKYIFTPYIMRNPSWWFLVLNKESTQDGRK